MKKLSILFIIIGLLLVGCSQKEQIETSSPVGKSNSGLKMEHLDLKGKNEIATFNTAVRDSTKQPGIVNMANPQYQFSLGEDSYFLWSTVDNGTIMNTKDTHTIYSLSSSSIKEVNEFVNKN
ncbi:hypothetical protein [Sporosarcina sp. E16_8]|uniref:hypothetical protein n=1 Tax=Sporosarcina sp. E16_8 TaxID=2789295 RepID=UPI001A92ABDF|nr:hypothetical protein [Sporosarcina sp. E16_8]MBO0587867.1 hypothetical protein [Sporosarcina sp. E16_8]